LSRGAVQGEDPGIEIRISDLRPIGQGIDRPEQVLVAADGRVYASDRASAVAELTATGLRRIGQAGGEPNGIALLRSGRILIANFGLGVLQELDPDCGSLRILLSGDVEGRPLQWINCVVVDRGGGLWCSVCTDNPNLRHTLAHGEPDGYIFRVDAPGEPARVVAPSVAFPNCMALSGDERYLYAVRTLHADVVRFALHADRLGPAEAYGPPVGDRRSDEFGDHATALLGQPDVLRRWGMADGCAFDGAGNLWVTLARGNRVVAITPGGAVVDIVDDADAELLRAPTSVAFGGADMRDVYIGSLEAPYVLRGRSSVPGLPMVHQQPG
jgi:gluconolactonase